MAELDLSGLSSADLQALANGDIKSVSPIGMKIIQQRSTANNDWAKPDDPGVLGSAVIGAGRTVDRVVKGGQQAYYGIKSLFESPDLNSLIVGKTPSQIKLDQLKQSAEDDNAAYKGLQVAHPVATGVGEALPSLVIPAGGGATLGANMLRMGAAGALPGALEYGSLDERAKRAMWGAATGAVAPAAVAGVKGAASLLEPTFKAGQEAILSRLLNRVAGADAPNVTSRLANAAELVPGSAPTAAQVAENGGVSALERAATQANPTDYAARGMAQSNARLSALRGVAGDPAALQAAQDARKSVTEPLYQQALGQSAPVTPELQAVLDRLTPDITSRASRLSQLESGAPLNLGSAIPSRTVAATNAAGAPILQQTAAIPASVSGKTLHYLKMGVDDAMTSGPQVGMGSVERGLLGDLQGNLVNHIDSAIPAYQTARQTFSQMSRPINQMQVGQELYNKVAPALRDFGGLTGENAATYARALREGDATAQSVTGMKGAKLSDVMSPEQMGTLNSVAADLARKQNAENLGRGVGSNTFQNLSMSNLANQVGMPWAEGLLTKFPGVANVGKWAYGKADEHMQGLLSNVLLDPKAAAALMTKTQPKVLAQYPELKKILEQTVFRSGLLAAPVANNAAASASN